MSEERQSAPDPLLLRWQEDDLYEAEKKVLHAFRKGQLDEFVVLPEGDSDVPKKPTDDRILRADFLRDLFLERYEGVEPLPLVISRAWVEGILQLSYREIRLPLLFSHCVFSSPMFLRGATIPELQLSGCDLRGGFFGQSAKVIGPVFLNEGFKAGGEVDLHSAEIGGQLICRGGHFKKGLNAISLKASSYVLLDKGFKAEGKWELDDGEQVLGVGVNLDDAEIGGLLICSGGHFEGAYDEQLCYRRASLSASNMKVKELKIIDIDIIDPGTQNCFFSNGSVDLRGAEVSRDIICDSIWFKDGLNAENLKVGGNVHLQLNDNQTKYVNLNNAKINGNLSCNGRYSSVKYRSNPNDPGSSLEAENLKVGGNVLIGKWGKSTNKFDFHAEGKVNLSGAEIGGEFTCTGGDFDGGLDAQDLKVGSHVLLGMGRVKGLKVLDKEGHVEGFERSVNLSGAEIGGNLDLSGSAISQSVVRPHEESKRYLRKLQQALDANKIRLRQLDPNYRDPYPGPEPHLNVDNQGTDDEQSDARIKIHDTAPLDLSNAEVKGTLRLSDDQACSAEGFRYWRIKFVEQDGTEDGDWKKGWEWLKKMPSGQFQPYKQLMAAYRRMGHSNWARNIGFQLEKKRSEKFDDLLRLPWRMWYGILRWTIGYGYRPFASFLWAAGLLVAGSLLFSSGHEGFVSKFLPSEQALVNEWLPNEWIPSDGEALASPNWQENREPSPDYLPFNPVIYSLESTFPVLNLGQLDKWHPSNPFLLGVRWAWTLIGTLLLAILALFGAGVLGPRTQSGDDSG